MVSRLSAAFPIVHCIGSAEDVNRVLVCSLRRRNATTGETMAAAAKLECAAAAVCGGGADRVQQFCNEASLGARVRGMKELTSAGRDGSPRKKGTPSKGKKKGGKKKGRR